MSRRSCLNDYMVDFSTAGFLLLSILAVNFSVLAPTVPAQRFLSSACKPSSAVSLFRSAMPLQGLLMTALDCMASGRSTVVVVAASLRKSIAEVFYDINSLVACCSLSIGFIAFANTSIKAPGEGFEPPGPSRVTS